jgi:hypothetical protein
LKNDYPADFFCFGLPGNTLPLGNWDPFGLQLVNIDMVRKYRESEIKHGRLAMLACFGYIAQEICHPLHPDIGGLSCTHMSQLVLLSPNNGIHDKISDFFGIKAGIRNVSLRLKFYRLLFFTPSSSSSGLFFSNSSIMHSRDFSTIQKLDKVG